MNRNTLYMFFSFTVGAAIGSAVTWKIIKTKYEQIAQEEIDSVKSEYSSLMHSIKNKLKENIAEETDNDHCAVNEDREQENNLNQEMMHYDRIASKYRGTSDEEDDYDEENDEKGDNGNVDEEGVQYINGPYVISADEFNSSPPGYSAQPLDYFADGILADSWGVKLDIDETIGEESLNHFGEEQDDIVYVRNERNEVDYEVTRDPRTYEETIRTSPSPYYGQ